MRKILFGLFIAISYMANAALPVVNDSVLVEAKEDDAYYDMFLKSLPDSVYDSPMVTRFFREVGGLGNIKISLIEHYSLNGKNKNHYLKFDISDAISSIGILMSYDDVKSIITILTDIYENTKALLSQNKNIDAILCATDTEASNGYIIWNLYTVFI